uniref:glutathione transferase n=1 Tax=Globodera rostochiensis TaxID=31243 RepID=A0A914GZU3_GLORO
MEAETKNYKLTYFSSRGIAEPIRLIFHYKGIPFEDVTFKSFIDDPIQAREHWLKHKQLYLYGQLPNLEWDEGAEHKALAQSQTICRYLANKYGLVGSDFWESAKADEIAEWFKDIWAAFVPFLVVAVGVEPGDKEAKKREVFLPLIYDRFVPILVEKLNNSDSGFLLPSGVTWTDFVMANALTTFNNIEQGELFKNQKVLADYEKRVYSSNENIKKYVDGRPKKEF